MAHAEHLYQHCVLFVADLEIVGFIEIADISSPPVISRHLVLPIAVNKGECVQVCVLSAFPQCVLLEYFSLKKNTT